MFVSTNSNSFAVGLICIIAVSAPTFKSPSPFAHVTKNPDSPELNLNTSSIKNQNEKERLLRLIDSCKNVYLSYSLSSMSGEMVKSSFLNSLNDVIEIKDNDENSYSDEVLKLEYFKELDNFNKYNVESESLRKLEKYFL